MNNHKHRTFITSYLRYCVGFTLCMVLLSLPFSAFAALCTPALVHGDDENGTSGIGLSGWISNGDGTFSTSEISFSGFNRDGQGTEVFGHNGSSDTYYADANNDGFTDIIHATENNNNSIYVWLNKGDNTFETTAIATTNMQNGTNEGFTGQDGEQLGWIADVNTDGNIDYVFSGDDNRIHSYLGNGDGTFVTVRISSRLNGSNGHESSGYSNRQAFFLTDVTSDGLPDLVGAAQERSSTIFLIWRGNNNGTFISTPVFSAILEDSGRSNSSGSDDEEYSDLADVDGDGDLDYIHAEGHDRTAQIWVFLNNGNGTFATNAVMTDVTPPDNDHRRFAEYNDDKQSFFADLNGDGREDYVISLDDEGSDNGIYVYLATAGGAFATTPIITLIPKAFATGERDKETTDIVCGLFTITVPAPIDLDFGDAPDSSTIDADMENAYPTLAADNGASHTIDTSVFLGATIDSESNGQPTAAADGDNDDGVSFPQLGDTDVLMVNESNTLTITASTAGFLNVWLDHNQDGDWNDSGEHIFTNQALKAGNNALSYTQSDLFPTGNTYMRFRFTSKAVGTPSPTGHLPDGEVEDYRVALVIPAAPVCQFILINSDFEAIQQSKALTLLSETVVPGWSTVASDPDESSFSRRNTIEIWRSGTEGVPAFDGNQFAEINAFIFGSLYQDVQTTPGTELEYQFAHRGRQGTDVIDVLLGSPNAVISQTGGSGYATGNDAWQVYTGSYTVPAGQYITRFAFQAVSAKSNSIGNFIDNVRFATPCNDYSDTPADGNIAPNGFDITAYGEAKHNIMSGLSLGSRNDRDITSIASANAEGDGADDDGIARFPELKQRQGSYTLFADDMTANGSGNLYGWIDFNGNGRFETDEFASTTVTDGTVNDDLRWSDIYVTATDSTFARFRFTSNPLSSDNAGSTATNGEVEDYQLTIQTPPVLSCTFDNEIWYNTSNNRLYRYNTRSRQNTYVTSLLHTYGDIAYGKNGRLFGVALSDSKVYSIDPTNGDASEIASLDFISAPNSLSADNLGYLYIGSGERQLTTFSLFGFGLSDNPESKKVYRFIPGETAPQLWINFQDFGYSGSPSGDFVFMDGVAFVAWNTSEDPSLENNHSIILRVDGLDADHARTRFTQVTNLGSAKSALFGLTGNENGSLFGVSPDNQIVKIALNATLDTITTISTIGSASNEPYGVTGLTEAAGTVCEPSAATGSISGFVFEDRQYGGGPGRAFDSSGTTGLPGATIEIYDVAGTYLKSTTVGSDGSYILSDLFTDAPHYVRVVNNSVSSSRPGSNGSELAVMTYRSNGTNAVTNEVGGHNPAVADAPANDGGSTLNTTTFIFNGGSLNGQQAQSIQPITISGDDTQVGNTNFGFNFNTIVNTNASGQGSLHQFIANSNLLASTGIQQNLPATISGDYQSGDTVSVFMIPTTTLSNDNALIRQTTELQIQQPDISIDGRLQYANTGQGNIILSGNNTGQTNGIVVAQNAANAVLRGITIENFSGSAVVINGSDSVTLTQLHIKDNSQYGVLLENNAINTLVLANHIQGNGWAGIANDAVALNTFSRNRLSDNGGLGIDLGIDGVTANSSTDDWLNYPEIATGSSVSSNGSTIVGYDFDLDVPASPFGYRIEFFSNTTVDPSSHGEGQTYLGYRDIQANGNGPQNFKGSFNANQSVPENANIAVTLIEKTSPDSLGATSEFSRINNGNLSVCTDLLTDPNAALPVATIDENLPQITYLAAKDANGNPITYAISGGADAAYFVINPAMPGALFDCMTIEFVNHDGGGIIGTRNLAAVSTNRNVPPATSIGDYEAPVDNNNDNLYELIVTATDANGNQVTKPLNVVVQDVNEKPRIINATNTNFTERSTGIIVDLVTYDPDTGDEEGNGITYTINGGADAKHFSLAAETGKLRFITPPDYQSPLDREADNRYEITVRVADRSGLSSHRNLTVTVTDDLSASGINLRAKAMLQGAFDPADRMMHDTLRDSGIIPVTQPYNRAPFNHAGSEQINLDLVQIEGNDAVVDWVLLELRDANDRTQIMATKAALLQRDGDIIDAATGTTELNFPTIPVGDYYIGLQHRNHLRVVSASTRKFGHESASPLLDFSDAATEMQGKYPRLQVASNEEGDDLIAMLWNGDANHDDRVIATGIGSDLNTLLLIVLTAPDNTAFNSSYQVNGYHDSDLNMDGTTLYTGPDNETNILLSNILLHPDNPSLVSNYVVNTGLK